jgi:hypothetical protein
MNSVVKEVVSDAVKAIFGNPIVENIYRGTLVEAIVDRALRVAGWRRKDNWAGWDFEHVDGTRLEVKQSAARQTWHVGAAAPSGASFDIAMRTGHWDGHKFLKGRRRCRLADLYVFAHHAVFDTTADHRDPSQWQFYVVRSDALPGTSRISLAKLRLLAKPIGIDDLACLVAEVAVAPKREGAESIA